MKKYLFFLVLVIIAAGLIGYFYTKQQVKKNITSFEECAKMGFPIMDSYPPRCAVDGKTFTQNIGNELELRDLITISTPRPNQTITSPLEIRGAARGNWFFEASFPIKLVDEKGKIIAEGQAEATEEWKTENFVPYKAVLEFKTTAESGKLILEKDNPSGLPENKNQLEVPIRFK